MVVPKSNEARVENNLFNVSTLKREKKKKKIHESKQASVFGTLYLKEIEAPNRRDADAAAFVSTTARVEGSLSPSSLVRWPGIKSAHRDTLEEKEAEWGWRWKEGGSASRGICRARWCQESRRRAQGEKGKAGRTF